MKKQFLWLVVPLLILSCMTKQGIVYDESIPLEESAWVGNQNLGAVVGYNGITVEWKQEMGLKMIQIPAGDTLLEVNLDSNAGNTRYTGKGLIFQYNFQAGKQYVFMAGHDRESGDFGLRVYVWEIGERIGAYSDSNLEGFTPFLNVAGNTGTGTTVLE